MTLLSSDCHDYWVGYRQLWRTAGRHGKIAARATAAALPSRSTRRDLGKLKAYAERVLIVKLVGRWGKIAAAFGMEDLGRGDEVGQDAEEWQ